MSISRPPPVPPIEVDTQSGVESGITPGHTKNTLYPLLTKRVECNGASLFLRCLRIQPQTPCQYANHDANKDRHGLIEPYT